MKEDVVAEQIILADNQMIFRTGVAKVLSHEADLRVVAQSADLIQTKAAVRAIQRSIVVFPSSLAPNLLELVEEIERAGSKAVLILEHGMEMDEGLAGRVDGVVLRSIAGAQLVETLHKVAAGERVVLRESSKAIPAKHRERSTILERLTAKEVQVIALIAEGRKNKEIAEALATREQVVKNYLRVIFDKTGVSDRLELALFMVHHPELAEAAGRALASLAKSA